MLRIPECHPWCFLLKMPSRAAPTALTLGVLLQLLLVLSLLAGCIPSPCLEVSDL